MKILSNIHLSNIICFYFAVCVIHTFIHFFHMNKFSKTTLVNNITIQYTFKRNNTCIIKWSFI